MNSPATRTVKIAYLIPDQYWAGTITGAAEIFHGMSLKSEVFQNKDFHGVELQLLRSTRRKPQGFSGFSVETTYYADKTIQAQQFDAIIIPSVWNLSMDNLRESTKALEWLRLQHQQGCIIAGLVTGVFYLAEAGLLDGREATIHWASVNIFQQRYPKVKLSPKVQLIESDNIITTSTTPATFDVTLMIIQRFLGDRAAEYASYYFAIRDRDAPLPEFLEPTSHDDLVDAVRDRIRMNFAEDLTLDMLASEFNVTTRTLSRHFVNATGLSPINYLTKQRLNAARRLLQSTDLQVQQIAEQCGFGSATVFGRNFKQAFAITPRQYRETLTHKRENILEG